MMGIRVVNGGRVAVAHNKTRTALPRITIGDEIPVSSYHAQYRVIGASGLRAEMAARSH